jgi:hypothetical protein
MVFALERHTESNILRQDAEKSCPFSARPPRAMELVTGPCARLENQTKETVAVSEWTRAPLFYANGNTRKSQTWKERNQLDALCPRSDFANQSCTKRQPEKLNFSQLLLSSIRSRVFWNHQVFTNFSKWQAETSIYIYILVGTKKFESIINQCTGKLAVKKLLH